MRRGTSWCLSPLRCIWWLLRISCPDRAGTVACKHCCFTAVYAEGSSDLRHFPARSMLHQEYSLEHNHNKPRPGWDVPLSKGSASRIVMAGRALRDAPLPEATAELGTCPVVRNVPMPSCPGLSGPSVAAGADVDGPDKPGHDEIA